MASHKHQMLELGAYFRFKCNPRYLDPRSDAIILEILKLWVTRRKEVYKEQMNCKYQSLKSLQELFNSPNLSLEPGYIDEISYRKAHAWDLEHMRTWDCAKAIQLLDTLKSRGFIWPMLWWRPDIDGAVCSVLGTVDPDFDAQATLTMLEGRTNREKLQAFAEKLAPVIGNDFALLKVRLRNILSKEDIEKIAGALTDPSNQDEYGKWPINACEDGDFITRLRLRGSLLAEAIYVHDLMVLDAPSASTSERMS